MTQTTIGIHHTDFTINGVPTYLGQHVDGHRIEGLLFNVRAVQATFDDSNPATRPRWAYPDAGTWDAQRNTDEFCAALPTWRDHGVLAFTINFQGGGPDYRPDVYHHFNNNAFTAAGDLKPAYADRLEQVIAAADALGMIAIVGLFYGKHMQKFDGDNALWHAADSALSFLRELRRKNILIELANELNVCWEMAGYEAVSPHGAHLTLHLLRERYPMFLYGASGGGMNITTGEGVPSGELVEASDFVLLHGNGCDAAQLAAGIQATQALPTFQQQPKPLMINEDSIGIPNLDTAWCNRCSWGYYDQGYGSHWIDQYGNYTAHAREAKVEHLSGFQTPPINWTINTNEKRAFFRRVKHLTGA